MKRLIKYIVVIVFVFAGYEVFSQPPASFRSNSLSPNRKLSVIRENYVDKQLKLSDDEKAKFWPVYRQYHDEITAIRKAKRQNIISNKSSDQMTKDMQFDQQLLDTKKHYNQEFLKIMPPEKVKIIYQSEREFTEEMIKQLGERGNPDN